MRKTSLLASLAIALLPFGAFAQTVPPAVELGPAQLLVAPTDPLRYYYRYLQAAQLFYANKFKEAEPILEDPFGNIPTTDSRGSILPSRGTRRATRRGRSRPINGLRH